MSFHDWVYAWAAARGTGEDRSPPKEYTSNGPRPPPQTSRRAVPLDDSILSSQVKSSQVKSGQVKSSVFVAKLGCFFSGGRRHSPVFRLSASAVVPLSDKCLTGVSLLRQRDIAKAAILHQSAPFSPCVVDIHLG